MSVTSINKPVVLSTTVKFDSLICPGVSYTIRRMTAGMRAELEHSLLSYTDEVNNIYIDVQRAKDTRAANAKIGGSSSSKRGKVDVALDISIATSKVPVDNDTDNTDDEQSPSKLSNSVRDWDDVAQSRSADNKVSVLGIEKLRPIYIKLYLRRVTGLVMEIDVDGTDDTTKTINVVTAQDVLDYATNDFVEEIFYSIYNSKQPGMSLSALELSNLQLPTISQNSTGGQQSEDLSSIAPDVKSKVTTSA